MHALILPHSDSSDDWTGSLIRGLPPRPFGETIYGARLYNQPWLFPFLGRIILVSDSVRLSDRIVGLDKINHFIREGLAHWRDVQGRA